MISEYHFGSMIIEGRRYMEDLRIIDGRVIPKWWRKEGHSMDLEDADDILAANPEVLVVGMGQPGRMQVTDSLRSALAEKGIELIEEPTAQALHTFNRLFSRGKRVAGAFHLTC